MTKAEEFEGPLQFLLSERKFDDVLDLLKNPENDVYVSDNVWNLIRLICETVKTESLLKSDADIAACKKAVMLLVERGDPKETLVSLLEQADSFKDHEFFCMLLDPFQYTLQKVPGKRGKSLQWVLSALHAHIQTLNEPEDLDLQGEEKLLLDTDPAVQDAVFVLSHYLHFIEFFVDEVSSKNFQNKKVHSFDRIHRQRELLHRYILKLLECPFLYHDLHVLSDARPKSTMQTLCDGYVRCLSKICCNVFNLFKYNSVRNNVDKKSDNELFEDEDDIPPFAFANLSYLIFAENMALDFQPFVYSHLFIFMKNLKYILLLLDREENLILFKGLHLARNLLSQLENLQLNYDCVELQTFTNFCNRLLNIAIFSKFETHRKSALNIFLLYISKCNYKGRYHLIIQVLSTVKHSGAEGLVINLYKDYLHDALNGIESAEYFLGKNFIVFVKQVFVLSDGVETDIIENSNKIITSLNFLRYVLLRDKKEINSTKIWNLIDFISENFVTPLITGLDFSRAHYKQALLDAENAKKEDKETVNATVTCNNEILPNVPVGHEKDMFEKALTAFDVIENILSRVKELM